MDIKRDTPEFENEVAKLVSGMAKESNCTGLNSYGTAHMEKEQFKQPEQILCPRCGGSEIWKYGVRGGVQYYFCESCKRKFTEKDAPYHMKSPADQIGAALSMFYDGLSVADIARHFSEVYDNPVNASTVYRWVMKYTRQAIELFDSFTPQIGDIWVVDETAVKVAGKNWWYWDILCDKTRFLIGSHLSRVRTINDVVVVMESAYKKTGKEPKFILSDSLAAYPEGIERVFGANSKHIKIWGMRERINNNIIERFHGTIKERIKVMRGLKSSDTAKLILDGWGIHYNYFRPHMSLDNRTPAEVAGIKIPFENWTDLVKKTQNPPCVIKRGEVICRSQKKRQP